MLPMMKCVSTENSLATEHCESLNVKPPSRVGAYRVVGGHGLLTDGQRQTEAVTGLRMNSGVIAVSPTGSRLYLVAAPAIKDENDQFV
jgi:hypothetical protein